MRFFFAANTCIHRVPVFQQRAWRPRIVDFLGYWELNLTEKEDGARKGPESMVDFLLLSFSSTLQG